MTDFNFECLLKYDTGPTVGFDYKLNSKYLTYANILEISEIFPWIQ